MTGRYLTPLSDQHMDDSCATPNSFRLGTFDPVGTVWECECGRLWVVRYILWPQYKRMGRADERRYRKTNRVPVEETP
jgi:hypothetical protein